MKYTGFISLSIFVLFSACATERKGMVPNASKEDYEILNCTFVHLTYGRYALNEGNEYGYDNWNKEEFKNDEVEKIELLTTQKPLKHISTYAATYNYSDLNMQDKSFKPLFDNLKNNLTDSTELDLKLITNLGSIRLKPIRSKRIPEYNAPKKWMLFSNFSYNSERTKAVFFYMVGDHSYFITVKKKGDVWIIVDLAQITDLGNW